jgi:hypothetical protein
VFILSLYLDAKKFANTMEEHSEKLKVMQKEKTNQRKSWAQREMAVPK